MKINPIITLGLFLPVITLISVTVFSPHAAEGQRQELTAAEPKPVQLVKHEKSVKTDGAIEHIAQEKSDPRKCIWETDQQCSVAQTLGWNTRHQINITKGGE